MFKRLVSAATVFGATALAPPSLAQNATCLPRDVLVETLEDRFSETLTGGGLQSADRLIEVWSSANGSFTVIMTQANGISCVVASGQSWQSVVPVYKPKEKAS